MGGKKKTPSIAHSALSYLKAYRVGLHTESTAAFPHAVLRMHSSQLIVLVIDPGIASLGDPVCLEIPLRQRDLSRVIPNSLVSHSVPHYFQRLAGRSAEARAKLPAELLALSCGRG